MRPIPMSVIRNLAKQHLPYKQPISFRGCFIDEITVVEDQEDWLKRMQEEWSNDGISPDRYQVLSRRTQNNELSIEDKRRHAAFGLFSEAGEIASLFQHIYQGKDIDKEKVQDESGDLLWFLSELLDTFFINLSDVMRYNIDKLKERYPTGFSAERSEHRHDGET